MERSDKTKKSEQSPRGETLVRQDEGSEPLQITAGGAANTIGAVFALRRNMSDSTELYGTSFYLFGPQNRLRQRLRDLLVTKTVEMGMICLAVVNCIFMTLDDYHVAPDSFLRDFLDTSDRIFTAIFTLEMVAKMLAFTVWEVSLPF